MQVLERVSPAGRAGDGLAVKQVADRGNGLRQPVQPLAEAAAEVEAERVVLQAEPGSAEAHDRPAAADVVDGGDRLDARPGLRNVFAPTNRPELCLLGCHGNRGQGGVALDDGLVRVTEDGEQVVPGPDVVVAQRVGALRGT